MPSNSWYTKDRENVFFSSISDPERKTNSEQELMTFLNYENMLVRSLFLEVDKIDVSEGKFSLQTRC